jgi:hypothetical protein
MSQYCGGNKLANGDLAKSKYGVFNGGRNNEIMKGYQ